MEYEQPQKTATAKIVTDDDVVPGSEVLLEKPVVGEDESVRKVALPLPVDAVPTKAIGIFPYYFLRIHPELNDAYPWKKRKQ